MVIDKSRTYIGIVEDNADPNQLGRCRIRVVDIYDNIPTSDLPWASPWKDLNGNGVNIPDIGKVVTVVFDSGNIYMPEFIFADSFNINLEQKLKSLDSDTYITMKALIFDHKTQIFVNDEEGLKIDYKFNNINMLDSSVNVNLKDNYSLLNLGDSSANQASILGTNFLNWFDTLVNTLLNNAFLGNLGAPVAATPDLIDCLQQYQQLRNPKFLSHNIFMNDNNSIQTVRQQDNANPNLRPDNPQIGDSWTSTTIGNDLTTQQVIDFAPQYGNGTETPTVANGGGISTGDGKTTNNSNTVLPPVGQTDPTVLKIIQVMQSKGYTVETTPYYLNLVGIRFQYEGQPYSNSFIDTLYGIWMNTQNQWEFQKFPVSTIPGLYYTHPTANNPGLKMKMWCKVNQPNGLGILYPAQYLNIYQFNESQISPDNYTMRAQPFFSSVGPQKVYRDTHFTSDNIYFDSVSTGNFGIFIHRGFPGGSSVNLWSEGCTVIQKQSDLNSLSDLARIHIQNIGNHFHYTLMTSDEIQ